MVSWLSRSSSMLMLKSISDRGGGCMDVLIFLFSQTTPIAILSQGNISLGTNAASNAGCLLLCCEEVHLSSSSCDINVDIPADHNDES